MTDLIPLSKLNALRHKSCPKSLRSLRKNAAEGRLPGAVHIYGYWHVDLEKYDKTIAAQLDDVAHVPGNEAEFDELAEKICRELEYKKAS